MNEETIGNEAIFKSLSNSEPLMVARFGSVELDCVSFYDYECLPYGIDHKNNWPECISSTMCNPAGFFPIEDWALCRFSSEFLKHTLNIDIIGRWHKTNEEYIISKYCQKALQVPLRSIEPYYHENPWSIFLKDKKVLVIHPYEESIKSQYKKRELLFQNPDVLPSFDLTIIKAVQSIAGNKTKFNNWFEAYDFMCSEIINKEFDVALIGAGAYGLPLASFVKSLGKKAVHMGGALQIFFGIKGGRWDIHDVISKLYNEHWVRPLPSETPLNYSSIEAGCYW
jgi:hypothetical protein